MNRPSKFPTWLPRGLLLAGLCSVGGAVATVSGCASTPESAAQAGIPLSPVPLYGKFVWHDLVTDNPAAAKRFYSQLFGWEFTDIRGGRRPYSLIRSQGRWIGGLVHPASAAEKREGALWLGYVSVPDVDRAVTEVSARGGKTLDGPVDVRSIGRAAVVADPQGAAVGFVRSQPGDPADNGVPGENDFLWMEYLAQDPVAAADFYKELLGYAVRERPLGGGPHYVLAQGNHPRGGVLANPVKGARPNWLTYIRVKDPAALASRVQALGGRVLMAPRPDARGGSLALIADPSGAVLALQRYPFQSSSSAEAPQ
ncbi:VOC family protein [Comamonas sp. JC664]|uniref:VOC family protein n=1 Tax=Comamonas sp. JC664 TaxID=2801917 RepID=UPI0017499664|nr:VOC family protein [Comamonas sp. JC664]MBL0693863.1 VOC family protein [Comamonas sp. JC664]GHG74831.1 glyoxalase [Comamonas sp. KCTC 72670]